MVAAEDYNTWLRIAQITNRFLYIDKTLGYYLFHSNGLSRKDLTNSIRAASIEFLNMLTSKEVNKYEARLKYIKEIIFIDKKL